MSKETGNQFYRYRSTWFRHLGEDRCLRWVNCNSSPTNSVFCSVSKSPWIITLVGGKSLHSLAAIGAKTSFPSNQQYLYMKSIENSCQWYPIYWKTAISLVELESVPFIPSLTRLATFHAYGLTTKRRPTSQKISVLVVTKFTNFEVFTAQRLSFIVVSISAWKIKRKNRHLPNSKQGKTRYQTRTKVACEQASHRRVRLGWPVHRLEPKQ